ncbi:serine/threonine-protein kinase [Planobispora takensis]|uniref:non-specific serine/threonine protein kinase n=1 Tax=Planobispora takensis TaxID=1367882 RepID=A0A8J3T0B5_9ACTN|nr:serine/threonine-protein kinase [Planobispora takensis]GII03959.1 hypothetical protein Pta02_59670 [Planobispora takensis]
MHGMPSAWRVPGYTEIRELGAGAAGRVVMARHDANGILVAIKYLSEELRSDVSFVARFRHEARVLHSLNDRHAVRLYDYVETGEGAAIIMELVNGVALRALLRSEGPTGPEAALLVLRGSLMGLAAAHKAGVVHRDFKPENVMVEADGTSRLVDFGIAVRAGDGDAPAGTPPYMAPEQWTGSSAGPSTDVYAATVVFFECLTGTRPFRAQSVPALARQHQVMPPPVEEVPPALQGLVERGLAKHPADRPPTAAAFLSELEAVAAEAYGPDWQERGRRRLAALAGLLAALFPLEEKAPETDTSLAETDLGEGGFRSLLGRLSTKLLVGAACVAVIAGVTIVLVGSDDTPAIQTQSAASSPTPEPSSPEESIVPVEETEEPAEDPAEETPEPDPTPTAAPTGTAAPPPATAAPETPTAKPTKKPTTKAPTRAPTKAPTKKPSPSPTSEESSDVGQPDAPPTRTTAPTPTPTPTRTTAAPTVRPTRPTTRPTTATPTATATPSDTPTETPR